jgi:hypothetical protein
VLYAIGNSGDLKFKNTLIKLTRDSDPTIVDAAYWAIGEIKKNAKK